MKKFLLLFALLLAAPAQAQNTFLANDGTFKVVPNTGLANMAASSLKCNPTGSIAAAQDCSGATSEQLLLFTGPGAGAVQRLVDAKLKDTKFVVTDFGADPTGVTANFGTAFNAAMAACVFTGNLGIARNGTVFIPDGFYKLGSTVMNWLAGCNIFASHAAYIQANVSVTNLLVSTSGAANSLQDVHLEGGQWDCNANVTQDGFTLPDFARLMLSNFRMYGCNGAAGNGSVGGFIRLGGATATQFNGLNITNAYLYNFTSPVATLVAGNQGIFTDPSGTGLSDSFISNTIIAGVSIGYQGNCFDCIFYNNHTFVFPSQGNMVNGFKLTSGQVRLTNNQVDGPLVSANAAYDLSGTKPYTLVGNGYFEATRDNVSNFVNIGAGTIVKSYGNHLIGNTGASRILTDYTGTLTNLSAVDDYRLNVSTSVGASSPIISGINGSFGGSVAVKGSTSGTVTQTAQAVAGTPAVVWGTSSGTPAVTATAPLAITTATGNATCGTCATTTNGGALSATAPIAISAGGVISITSPLPVANGGTGDTGTAWTSFSGTAAPTCGTATITTGSARSKTLGKTTFVEIDFTITALGTCTNSLSWTMPNTSTSPGAVSGQEVTNTGKGFSCPFVGASSNANPCRRSDATAWAVNDRLIGSGVYENQ